MEKKELTTMHAKDMKQTAVFARIMGVVVKIFTYLFLFIMALSVLFPFYWMLSSSLKTEVEYRRTIPTFIPQHVDWNEYYLVRTNEEIGSVEKTEETPVEAFGVDMDLKTLVYSHDKKNSYYLGMQEGENAFGVYNTSDITGENAANVGVTRFPAHLYQIVEEEIKLIDNPRASDSHKYKLGADFGNGTVLYFNGQIDANGRLLTTENIAEAVDLQLERAAGQGRNYYMFFTENGKNSYIRAYHEDTGRMKYYLPSNYVEAFNAASLGRLFMNTLFVGVVSTLLSVIITVLSAFAFARLEFKGKDTLFAALLATMMIPGELFTITNYMTVNRLGWMNSFTALIVPFLVSVFYIYLLRQNFQQIPNELYLAAKVDGTSDLKYLWKVMVPLALPTLISITILKMMGAWNTYIWPKLVANDEAHRLITNGLRNAFTTVDGQTNFPVQMAAVAIVSAPLFMVFLFLRKYIMAGVSRSGIKG